MRFKKYDVVRIKCPNYHNYFQKVVTIREVKSNHYIVSLNDKVLDHKWYDDELDTITPDQKLFNLYVNEAIQRGSLSQFAQLCDDIYTELNQKQRQNLYNSSKIIEIYYQLGRYPVEVAAVGRFIRTGKYLKELSFYETA